jgi:transposase-like protein
MPWKELTPMSQRKEFVNLALAEGSNMARLCRRFEISRKIGYKWLARYLQDGEAGLADRSRRPRNGHRKTPKSVNPPLPRWGRGLG